MNTTKYQSASGNRRRFGIGDTLIDPAVADSHAYIIERGEVAVWRDNPDGPRTLIARLGAGQMVGELALVDGERRTATVTAVTECTARVVTADDLTNHLDGVHPVIHTLIDALLERVRANDHAAAQTRSDTPSGNRSVADAVASGALQLVYEPLLDLPAGQPAGHKARVVWSNPTPGQPDAAAALRVEPSGPTLAEVTSWSLLRACADVAALQRVAGGCFVSLSLTSQQLAVETLVDDVFAAVSNAGIAPGQLVLAINEADLPEPGSAAAERLHRCHAGGVRIAAREFGAVLAPLARISDLPIDIVAVHSNLLRDTQGAHAALVALRSLAEAMGLRLCATDVATQAALRRAMAHGIHRIHRTPNGAGGMIRSVRSDDAVSPDDGVIHDGVRATGRPAAARPQSAASSG